MSSQKQIQQESPPNKISKSKRVVMSSDEDDTLERNSEEMKSMNDEIEKAKEKEKDVMPVQELSSPKVSNGKKKFKNKDFGKASTLKDGQLVGLKENLVKGKKEEEEKKGGEPLNKKINLNASQPLAGLAALLQKKQTGGESSQGQNSDNPIFKAFQNKLTENVKTEIKTLKGEQIHNQFLTRRSTAKWLDENAESKISYAKMELIKSMSHPRLNINGKREKIPLCMPTGRLAKIRTKQMYGMDELGLGISIYFKLLKSVVLLMAVMALITSPVFYIYGAGQMKMASNTSWLSYLAIGNIGMTQQQCNQNNFIEYNDIYIQCPGGTNVTDLLQFGLKDTQGNSTCPHVNLNSKGIDLSLKEQCNWYWEQNQNRSNVPKAYNGTKGKDDATYKDKGIKFYDKFIKECLNNNQADQFGKQNCLMSEFKLQSFWPQSCWDYITEVSQKDDVTLQIYATVQCNGTQIDISNTLFPDIPSIERDFLAIFVVSADLACVFGFLIYLWFITYFIKVDAERHKNLLFETQEFAVEINNLPQLSSEYPPQLLKAELWDHLEKCLKQQNQQIERLSHTKLEQACQIVDIQFAMSDYKYLEHVVQISKISTNIQNLEMQHKKQQKNYDKLLKKQENLIKKSKKTQSKKVMAEIKFKTKLKVYKQLIDDHRSNYYDALGIMGDNNQAIAALVTFRSMEGVQRTYAGFKIHKVRRMFSDLFQYICIKRFKNCCYKKGFRDVKFHNKWLRVKQTVDPELLLWQNYGVSKLSKCIRTLIYAVIMGIILVCCFYGILYFEDLIYQKELGQPDINCDPNTSNYKDLNTRWAYADYVQNNTQYRNGDFHCYCYQQFNLDSEAAKLITFGPKSETLCADWIKDYWNIFWFGLLVPLCMAIINIIVELIIQAISQFTRPINETVNLVDSITGITWIQFVNLGFILIFMSLNIEVLDNRTPPGFFSGKYDDFNTSWYARFGEQTVRTMMIETAVVHLPSLVLIVFFGIWRLWDRGCTFNIRNTKQILQHNYEDINIGPEFLLDAKLAQITACLWITFMFSPGMPFLYVVSAINFTGMYWIDKALVLRFFRSPKNYDETTIKHTVSSLKLSFVFHFWMGIIMFSNKDLMASEDLIKQEQWDKIEKDWFPDFIIDKGDKGNDNFVYTFIYLPFHTFIQRLFQTHIIVFIVGMFLIALGILFEGTIFVFLNKYCSCFKHMQKTFEKMDAISDDYYDEIHLKFLLAEYARAKLDKDECLKHMIENQGKGKESYDSNKPKYNKFVKFMIQKERLIENKIVRLCKLVKVNEATIDEKIKSLKKSEGKLLELKNFRMKSKVQSYDLRDCEEYYGILELEKVLRENQNEEDVTDQLNENLRKTHTMHTMIKRQGGGNSVKRKQLVLDDSMDEAEEEDAQDGVWDIEKYSKDIISDNGASNMFKVNSAIANANLDLRSDQGNMDKDLRNSINDVEHEDENDDEQSSDETVQKSRYSEKSKNPVLLSQSGQPRGISINGRLESMKSKLSKQVLDEINNLEAAIQKELNEEIGQDDIIINIAGVQKNSNDVLVPQFSNNEFEDEMQNEGEVSMDRSVDTQPAVIKSSFIGPNDPQERIRNMSIHSGIEVPGRSQTIRPKIGNNELTNDHRDERFASAIVDRKSNIE